VAHNGGLSGRCAGIEEASSVDVRQIDDHAGRLAVLDQLETPRREAAIVAPPATVRRIARFVRAEVKKAEVADTAARELVEPTYLAFECVRSFDAQEGGNGPVATNGFHVVGRSCQPHGARIPRDRLVEDVDLLVYCARKAPHVPCDGKRDEPEELPSDASLPHPGDVDVAAEGRAPQGGLVPRVDVVSEPARPHQRVGVQVDGGMSSVQCEGLARGRFRHIGRGSGARAAHRLEPVMPWRIARPSSFGVGAAVLPGRGWRSALARQPRATTVQPMDFHGTTIRRCLLHDVLERARFAMNAPPLLPPVVADDVLELVGETPLVAIRTLGRGAPRADVWAKMEHANPAGSVKDRICLSMIEEGERSGRLAAGGVVVEPTSGNTGIGLALVCAVRGYRCILTMPASMSLERRQLLEAFGAQVILTPDELQMEGALAKAREVAAATPGAFLPQQFDNPANPRIHSETTAREIIEAMYPLSIDAFVAGVGTGGTITGVGRVLRQERSPRPRIVAVEPDACATLSRGERGPTKIQGLAAGFVPHNYDASVVDEVRTVTDAEAWRTKRALARREGLLVGISAGAAVHAALEVARELGEGKNVVTVLPDTGERYFSLEEYFEEEKA
jgi:cysteine synthase A